MSLPTTESAQLSSYIKMVFRRKEFLIIGALLGLAIGISLAVLLPRQYQSATVILVEEGKTDNPLFDKLAVSTTVQERLATIQESMLGWNSLVKLVRRLGLDSNVKNAQQFENLILGIRKHVSIKMRGPNVLYLAYTGDDPQQTQAVVKNITDIFIERNVSIQNQETSDAITFIEEQLKIYKGKIKSAEIARLQDRLDELLVDSTEMHPLVKQLREQIDRKKKELKDQNLEFTENIETDKKSTIPLISSIESALSDLEAPTRTPDADEKSNLYKLMLIDKVGNVVARDAEVNEQIYNELLHRIETAKITQRLQSSKEGTKYTVVDPPRVPLSPTQPNQTVVSVGGLLVGLGIGAGLIFLIEFFDKSFIDVEDAKEFLGVPLLGAISRLTTTQEISRRRGRIYWLYILSFLICAIIVTASFGVSSILQ